MKDKPYSLKVIYEDNHILVIEKAPGLLSQKDKTNEIDVTELAKEYLKEKYKKPGNVYLGLPHRLDKPVGGLMLLTKTSKAASRLSEDFRLQKIKKTYLALVEGKIHEAGKISIDIKKDKTKLIAKISDDGKSSVLLYKPLKIVKDMTLVEVELYTGRFHQIRLSLSSINHPIVNDRKYNATNEKGPLYLWAHKLSFTHPVTKQEISLLSKPSNWPIMV